MEPNYVVVYIIVIALVIGTLTTILIAKRKKHTFYIVDKSSLSRNTITNVKGKRDDATTLSIHYEILPSLTEQEQTQLEEIKENRLLEQIDCVVPGTLQIIANTGANKVYQTTTKHTGQLYQAIIPKGASLDKSRAMDGAFRGSYREVPNRIKGDANWLPVDNKAANNLAAINAVNTAMSVASIIVGQYYMVQINNQLEVINSGIKRISQFQENEFYSKVDALLAEIRASAAFQIDNAENNELRNRELDHLKQWEYECAQLLSQANRSLERIADLSAEKKTDYKCYEKQMGEAEMWVRFQLILLQGMYNIAELTYTLNLGEMRREHSLAIYMTYEKQSAEALRRLQEWHMINVDRFGIQVEEGRRKRQGLDGAIMSILGFFKDELNYRKIESSTADRIEWQTDAVNMIKDNENNDFFQEDVRLVVKEGKLYYLPHSKQS